MQKSYDWRECGLQAAAKDQASRPVVHELGNDKQSSDREVASCALSPPTHGIDDADGGRLEGAREQRRSRETAGLGRPRSTFHTFHSLAA